jgi:hypothetical protein
LISNAPQGAPSTKGCALPQSLILLKELPGPDYLHNLQAQGVLRASMTVLPGGCYAGAGLYDASPVYSTRSAEMSSTADSGCPNPDDKAGCLIWELFEKLHRLSWAEPLDYNAFAFLEVEAGRGQDFLDVVQRVAQAEGPGTDYTETDRGREYVAAARLIGCGTYNTVVEVLAEDHDRVLEVLDQVTDLGFVRQYSVGRLAAGDARGFGKGETAGIEG